MGNGKRTKIDPEKVRELAAQGMTDGEIARHFGVSESVVKNCRHRNGIKLSHCRGIHDSDPERAKVRQEKKIATRDSKRRFTAADIRGLFASGCTVQQVAERFGMSHSGMGRLCKRHGIDLPNTSGKSISKARRSANARLPNAIGLPEWMTKSQVAILSALMEGSKTRREIFQRTGIAFSSLFSCARRCSRRSIINEMIDHGMISVTDKIKWHYVYSITPLALAMIAVSQPESHHAEEA